MVTVHDEDEACIGQLLGQAPIHAADASRDGEGLSSPQDLADSPAQPAIQEAFDTGPRLQVTAMPPAAAHGPCV